MPQRHCVSVKGLKIEFVTFFCIFLAQENETFVYWLRITEFILNNVHCTQKDCLAALLQSKFRATARILHR